MTDFIADMDALAAEIAIGAGSAEVSLADKVDAFKALMPYYIQLKKSKPPADDGLPNFSDFQSRIHRTETEDGDDEPGVRGSRRNGN